MPEDITEPVTDVVEEVTEPDAPGEAPPPVDVRPPWVDEIVEAITAIPDAIATATPNPVAPDDRTPGLPADGEVIEHDESPVSKPWTHKTPFKR